MAEPGGELAQKRRLLQDVIAEVRELGIQAGPTGQDVARAAQVAVDSSPPFQEVIAGAPSDSLSEAQLDAYLASWQSFRDGLRGLVAARPRVDALTALASGSLNTALSAAVSVASRPGASARVLTARDDLARSSRRGPEVARALASMLRLGLDRSAGGSLPATDHLSAAVAALDAPPVPDGGPLPVLVALRECIERVFADLLRRRPRQEKAGKAADKVLSIGGQCARAGLPPDHFMPLAADADPLIDDLSKAKYGSVSRERQSVEFQRGLVFLNAFLDGLDEARFKP
jgi:hypothetical protein